jgi:hypothetical protein
MIINSVMGSHLGDSILVNVVPGQASFMTIPIENQTAVRQVFEVRIEDPDRLNTVYQEV